MFFFLCDLYVLTCALSSPTGQIAGSMCPPSLPVSISSQQKMVIHESQQHTQQALHQQLHPTYRPQAAPPGVNKVPVSPNQYMHLMSHRAPQFIVPNTVPHAQQGMNSCEIPPSGVQRPGQVVLMQAGGIDGQLQGASPMIQDRVTHIQGRQIKTECNPMPMSMPMPMNMECSDSSIPALSPNRRLIPAVNHNSYHPMVTHPGGGHGQCIPPRSPNMGMQQNQHMMGQVQYPSSGMQDYPLQVFLKLLLLLYW